MGTQHIAVIGGGFMGSGIAQLAATNGHPVTLVERSDEDINHATGNITWSLKKLHSKELITPSPESILDRITTTTRLDDAADADLVFEAVPEIVHVKQEVFRKLDECCKPDTCFASNTSTIPIRLLADATNRPDKVVGTHFFFPVPINPLLELIPAHTTSAKTLTLFSNICNELGKQIIHVKKDVPGFIMNRVFGAMTCEAIRLVERGVCGVQDVDDGLTTGYGMIQGPLAKADMAGLDICLLAFSHIFELDKNPALQPPELLVKLVEDGHHGIKTGRGFYHYDKRGKPTGPAV